MRSLALRLLAFLAVLMLPLGMAAAPAAMHQSAAAEAMPMHHDHGDNSKSGPHGSLSECTMACSAALPASDGSAVAMNRQARLPAEPALETALSGIELEIATPPPKLS